MDVAMVNGIRAVIEYLLQFAMLLVFVSILVSFVGDSSNQIVQMIYAITKFTKNIPGPFDWAPFIVILIIIFLQNSIVAWMRGYG